MNFFSDREFGLKTATVNEITIPVWNGIVAIIDSFIADNSLSKDFPEQCPDNLGVSGFNMILFNDKLKAVVPNIKVPLQRKEETKRISFTWNDFDEKQELEVIDLYSCLDLIEFCYYHLSDAIPTGRLHDFFNHYHLSFEDNGKAKGKFYREINILFQRNQIAYKLNEAGQIIRVIPDEFETIIRRKFKTKDTILNELLEQASEYFLMPKVIDRLRALEKVWDAFERAKTFFNSNKNNSATYLIALVSNKNDLFETYLATEAKMLTEIGNKFHIRHFETDKQPINDIAHIDYLFYRMSALINLFINRLDN